MMSEETKASMSRNLSSNYGDVSPFSTKHVMHPDRRWTESYVSEPFHSTPKSSISPGAMPMSMSYPTLLSQHADPSPVGTAQSSSTPLRSPLCGGGGGVGLSPKKSASATNLSLSPHRPQSSPSTFIQTSPKKSYPSDLENTTVQKQRRELQLLIRELQDRDRELNEMVASHQRQLLAWEQDRQKLLALETKCARYEGELKNRSEYIKSVKTRLKVMTSQDQSKACALDTMQQQLRQLAEGTTAAKQRAKDLEEENGQLKSALNGLSERAGRLEAREQELSTLVKLKDKDLLDASSHITDLTGRLKKLDLTHKGAKQQSETGKQQMTELKTQLNESHSEMDKLKGDLLDYVNRGTEQRIEVGKLQEQNKSLRDELQLSAEREKRKDQLVELQRSKQERADAELSSLRQAYERQQRELSLLQLKVETHKERSRHDDSFKASLENSPLLDAKPNGVPMNHPSSTLSPMDGGSPLVSSAGEGGGAMNHSNVENEEPLVAAQSEQLMMSPTSKLHRLLTESRQMVENLEQSTLPPYIASSSPKGDQDKPVSESPPKSASFS